MFWGVVKHNPMRRIGQKRRPCLHGPENTTLALVAQGIRDPVVLGCQAHQTFRLMNVEMVGHKVPRAIVGSEPTVLAMCATKSASVRVGPSDGVMTVP
jgi:hypothetical protein